MDWTKIHETLDYLAQPAYLCTAVAALILIFIWIMLIRRQPKKIVAYQTENGRVMICRSAIVELVRSSCEHLDDVAKPSVKIHTKGNYTHFDVRLKLMAGARLKEIERTLQAHLRQGLSETLGIERIGQINIVAIGLKSGQLQISRPISAASATPVATALNGVDPSDPEALNPSPNQGNPSSTESPGTSNGTIH